MTIHRFRLTACVGLAILALSGASGRAQTQPPPTPTPAVQPRVEIASPPQPDLQALREQDSYRFRRPVFRLFQNYTLPAGESTREVFSVLADVDINGLVYQDVAVTMGTARLGSTAVVDGSLVVVGGSATISPGARVARDIVVIGGTLDAPADFVPGGEHVIIGTPMIGEALHGLAPWLTRGLLLGRLIVPDLGWVWTIVAIGFFIGLLVNHVFARQVGACADTLARRPIGTFLIGLLVIVLSGPVMIIVSATVIGLPFAIAGLVAASLIGKLGVTRAVGRSIVTESEPGNRGQAFRSYLLGFALITVAYIVPVIGILTWALVGVFGFGTAAITFMASLRRERPAAPPEPTAPAGPPAPPAPPVPPAPDAFPFSPPQPLTPPAASSIVEPPAMLAATPPPGAASGPSDAAPAGSPPVGPPPPSPPRTSGLLAYPRAAFFDRLAAFVLDAILVAIASNLLDVARHDGGPFLTLLLLYHIAFWAWKGTTLGGIICNVRIVRTTGEDPRFIDALVRGLSAIFSVAALGIGCLWMLNDPERQMWHDKIAGTVVVKVPRELVTA